ncbi:hypothetical protein GCM10028784_38770 [Myceligenerans cantabricum]
MTGLPIRHARRRDGNGTSPEPAGYDEFSTDLQRRVSESRHRAAQHVSAEMIRLSWQTGREILARQQRHGWDDATVDRAGALVRRELRPLESLDVALTGRPAEGRRPRDGLRVAEALEDLEALSTAYLDIPRSERSAQYCADGFHTYDLCVRELLGALREETP